MEAYISYAKPYSVFNRNELKTWLQHDNLAVIKMLYNAALTKRVIRKTLMDEVGLDRNAYSGFMTLTPKQFLHIVKIGGVSDRLIVT